MTRPVLPIIIISAVLCPIIAQESPSMPNIASGATVTSFTSVWNKDQVLVDGLHGSHTAKAENFWSSAFRPQFADRRFYPSWVQLDLGDHHQVSTIRLHPRLLGGASVGWPVDFTIQVAAEGDEWQTVVERWDDPVPPPEGRTYDITPVIARFIKITATRLRPVEPGKPSHHFQLGEVEVFGEVADPGPLPVAPIVAPEPARAAGLRCDDRIDPVGVDVLQPTLSWYMAGGGRGERQTAYRVLVASSPERLAADQGDLWDSGKVSGSDSAAIRYAGASVPAGARCVWKVRLWDHQGQATAWSDPASFLVGRPQPSDWHGGWIGADTDTGHAAVYLRKAVTIDQPVRRATVFWSGLGWSELTINGTPASDAVLSPGHTTYHRRTPYQVADVTALLPQAGAMVLGVVLADGWYNLSKDPWVHRFEQLPYVDRPKLLLDLVLEHEDGSTTVVPSDSTWRWRFGPITRTWIAEEDHDLRRGQAGWNLPGADEDTWRSVAEVTAPAGRLVAQREPPTRVLETYRPQQVVATGPETWRYDFGHEFQGWVRITASAPAGTTVTITTHPKGYTSTWTLAGTGVESYSPRFHYNAITGVTIKGLPQAPALDDVIGCQVATDLATTGSVRTSDPQLDWLHDTAIRTFVNYNVAYPNDPTREKKGWTQDFETQLLPMSYQFDTRAFFSRWHTDLIDGQRDDGNFPNIAPGPFYDTFNSTWWGGTGVWAAWQWYLFHGDQRLLTDNHEALTRYLDFLGKVGSDHMQDWGLPDWLAIEDSHVMLVNTPAYYHYARILADSAALQGRTGEAERFRDLATRIRQAFNSRFLDERGVYNLPDAEPVAGVGGAAGNSTLSHEIWWEPGQRVCTQGAQALALGLELVPDAVRPQAEATLLEEIAAHDGFISTGFVSSQYLLRVLADLAPNVGQAMVDKRQAPSWYAMSAGSGSDLMRETWSGGAVVMPPLGSGLPFWNYHALAGIRPDPNGPGFQQFIIKPCVVDRLHRVACRFRSAHGTIAVTWRRRGAQLALDVDVPANAEATIHVPTVDSGSVREGGEDPASVDGVVFLHSTPGHAVYTISSGSYRFTSEVRPAVRP